VGRKQYITPESEEIENRLEQVLLTGSNRLDDDFVISISPATMDEGNGSDAASRVFSDWADEQ
jgi:hypothetical protein